MADKRDTWHDQVSWGPARPSSPEDSGSSRGAKRSLLLRFSRSIRVQLIVLLAVFSLPPLLLYTVFASAEQDKERLLLEAIYENGRIIANALSPFVQRMSPGDFSEIPDEIARFESAQRNIKILYRPADGSAGFFYVASVPQITNLAFSNERDALLDLGVLPRLEASCAIDAPLGERFEAQDTAVRTLMSITPIQSQNGCWAIIVTATEAAIGGLIDGRKYWQRPEAQIALLVYVSMALIVCAIFATVWTTLTRFRHTAENVEHGRSFEAVAGAPELGQMGGALDAMVTRLRRATAILRQSAEDNAHAFKGPIAVIRQAVELASAKDRAERTLGLATIAASLDRLEGLVRSARHLDTAAADLLETKDDTIDLADIVADFVNEYQLLLEPHSTTLTADIAGPMTVAGRREMVETILENLVDNAISFSPAGGHVIVALKRDNEAAALSVVDEGPGVPPTKIPYIFDRYYSSRPKRPGVRQESNDEGHFGIGLWLVAENAHAMNGTVDAENRAAGGFMVTVRIPLV